jgi:hypothetical protein
VHSHGVMRIEGRWYITIVSIVSEPRKYTIVLKIFTSLALMLTTWRGLLNALCYEVPDASK